MEGCSQTGDFERKGEFLFFIRGCVEEGSGNAATLSM
jgi:hypothetical protein